MSLPLPPHDAQPQPQPQLQTNVTVRFHLDAQGQLSGAHTVPLSPDDLSPQLAVPLASETEDGQSGHRLTVGEAHGLLLSWHRELAEDATIGIEAEVALPIDGSRLHVTLQPAAPSSTLDWVELPDDVPVVLAAHGLTPAAAPTQLDEPFLTAATSLTASLSELAPAAAPGTVAFDSAGPFSVMTPLVEAVLGTVPALDVPQVVAGHFIWNGIIEQGYRPDISFHTLETLAARAGRSDALAAAFVRASDLAVETLGSHAPTPLLQAATAWVSAATGAGGDERSVVELTQAIAESFFRHLQVVVASAALYDVAPADDIQPPLRAWLMALEGPGEEFDNPSAP